MFTRVLLAVVLGVATHAAAFAADVRVEVRTPKGEPVPDAVVTISGPPTPGRAEPYRMEQKDLEFRPFVLVVPKGASVTFPNLDTTRHHVYSFSPAGPFELKLFGSGKSKAVKFSTTGTIAVGCNIHDQMSGFIRVTDAPYTAVTDKAGVAILHNVASGARDIEVWHPYQKGIADATLKRSVAIDEKTPAQAFALSTRRPLGLHGGY